MNTRIAITFACLAFTGVAMADTVEARYTGIAGGSDSARLRVEGGTYRAGQMIHEFTDGYRAGESFGTFCIDFSESARTRDTTYQIIEIADAPMPGAPYGQAISDKINAVVANAAALGWIDGQLQADDEQQDHYAKMGAIQAAIWEAFGSEIRIESRRTDNDLESYYNQLMNSHSFNSSLRIQGLKAMVSEGQQDMLYVVPLPPAAFAGLGMLGGLGGVRIMRRRK